MGVIPVQRHWQPRVTYAGTYDETWRRQRAPLWASDLDERFFCGAPEYLQASPHLKGGEPVILQGLHPDGPIGFQIPSTRFAARSRFLGRTFEMMPTLDGAVIDTDLRRLILYYRSAVTAPLRLVKHLKTELRLMPGTETGGL
jgi:hypothetical protein